MKIPILDDIGGLCMDIIEYGYQHGWFIYGSLILAALCIYLMMR